MVLDESAQKSPSPRPEFVRATSNEPPLYEVAPEVDELAPADFILTAQIPEGAYRGAAAHLLDGSGHIPQTLAVNGDGTVAFDGLQEGTYQFWVTAEGHASRLYTKAAHREGDASPTRVSLSPATELTGRIETPGGLGLPSVVTLVPKSDQHAPVQRVTDDNGEFAIRALPRGTWQLLAESKHFAQEQATQLQASEARHYARTILAKKASLRAQIVDERGGPVLGAMLRVSPISVASTNASPKAFLGSRWVHPLTGTRQMPHRHTRKFGASRPGVRPTECGQGHCGVDLGGERGAPVVASQAGTVITASHDDRGATGRYVSIQHPRGLVSYYMHLDSVADGLTPGMHVPAGALLGTLGRSGIRKSAPHLHFAIAQSDADRRLFVDPEPMLRFAVVLAEPASSRTSASRLPPAAVTFSGTAVASLGSTAMPAEQLRELPPGVYSVTAEHPDYAASAPKRIHLKPGQSNTDLRISLPAGVRITGKIVGPEGPVADTWVRAYQGHGESRRRVARAGVDSEGGFSLRPISGPVELEFGAAGFGLLRSEGTARKLAAEPLLLTFSRFDSKLRGQVRGPSGSPLAGVVVRIDRGPAGKGRRATTDAFGFYEFFSLPKGEYDLSLRGAGYREEVAHASTEAEHTSELSEGATMALELRDAHSGSAIAATRVHMRGPGGQATTALTGPSGRLTLSGLAPGRWRIRIDAAEHVHHNSRVEIAVGRAPEAHVIELQRGAHLSGVVRDEYGERVGNARVWVGNTETRTDASGAFELDKAPVGRVVLRSSASDAREGSRSGELSLSLDPGDELVTLDVRIQPAPAQP